MNKRFCSLTVIAVVLFTAGVFAQVSVKPGIAVGINSFTQKVDAPGMTITPDSKTGFVAGGVLDISLMELISIEPGLMYTMRGMKFEQSSGGTTVTATENLSYLTIPVHAKVKFVTPMIKPYALAGLNLGILLAAKDKIEMTGAPTVDEDVKDSVNAVDMGLDFGLGVDFSLPAITPFVEFAYYLGLMELAKNPDPDVATKSNGWEIKAGLRFKI
jgi:hypothetical protein